MSRIVIDLRRDGAARVQMTDAAPGARLHVGKTPRGLLVEIVPAPQPDPAYATEDPA